MKEVKQLTQQFREVHLDGEWVVATNLKKELSAVTWEQAITKVGPVNTIAQLAFHINYYVAGVLQVLDGGPLEIRDKFSFDMAPITSAEEWDALRNKLWADAERFAERLAELSTASLGEPFVDEKYGDYRRNIHVMIEHIYYHLGQIVLLRKLL